MLSEGKKLTALQGISEIKLCKEVLVPLFRDMGYEKVTFTGGTNEYGVDIFLCKREPTGRILYYAIIVETHDIHKRVSHKGVIHDILQHVRESLLHSIEIDTPGYEEKIYAHFIWIVTSKSISKQAKEYIRDEVQKNLGFRNIQFFEGIDLINFIEKYSPSLFYVTLFVEVDESDLSYFVSSLIKSIRAIDFDSVDNILDLISRRLKKLDVTAVVDTFEIVLQEVENTQKPLDYIRYSIAASRTCFKIADKRAVVFFEKMIKYTSRLSKDALDNIDTLVNFNSIANWSTDSFLNVAYDPLGDDNLTNLFNITDFNEFNSDIELEKYYAFLWYSLIQSSKYKCFMELFVKNLEGIFEPKLTWEEVKSSAWEDSDFRWIYISWIESVARYSIIKEAKKIALDFALKIKLNCKTVVSSALE